MPEASLRDLDGSWLKLSKGPVSYLVRMANGDVHHRHRNQLRRAWPTEKPSDLTTPSGFLRYKHLSTWSLASSAQVLRPREPS
ncbi:hypothetical protein MTO96_011282 [Rhipicephalus appendiculatus]